VTKFRLWAMTALLACLGTVVLRAPQATADDRSDFSGATYLLTVKDAHGAFASREVITLHGDHTLSTIASGQGGPTFFFSSQLGEWTPDGKRGAVGRTLDFDFPPPQSQGVARLDYTFQFPADDQVTGTITLTDFPLMANPLDGGGTLLGTFTFAGTRVTP
jgi:hypothetical protein